MIHIITGSTLGGAEYVGDHLSDLLQEQGFDTKIHNQPNMSEIPAKGTWLIITSTHGAGEYPDNIQPFIQALQNTPPNTSALRYAVVAIGDSSYDTFCAAGKHAYQLLGILVLNLWPTALPSMYKSTQCLKMPLKLGSNASSIASK